MLRFKNDDGSEFPEWEEKKIGELGAFIKGAALSKADISESGSPLILYGELYTTYKEVAYNIQRKTQAVVDKKYYSCVGDVIIPTSGESAEEISTATCVMVPDVILGGDLNIFRSDIVDGRIMSYILNHQAKWKIATIAQGKSIVHIQAKQLANICVKYPLSKVEQQKIAEFLSTIDTVIEKQKETVSAWEERKKGVMQKLFSQEVRFKADDGSDFPEWENVTVLDLLVQPITDGPHETPVLEENGVSFVSVEAIDNGRVNLTKRRGFISKEYDNVCAKKYKPQLYDVYMVKSGATTGKVAIVTITDDFNIWSPLAAMRTSSKTEAFFLYYQLQSDMIQNQVWTKLSLGNQPNLGMRALELFSAVRPCLAEQQKIADCLSSLDEVIEKQKATLAAWEEMKKGLLQQMFV